MPRTFWIVHLAQLQRRLSDLEQFILRHRLRKERDLRRQLAFEALLRA